MSSICAHGLSDLGRDYEGSRLGIVAISSNDVTSHPTDGPDQIAVRTERTRLPVPLPVRREPGGCQGLRGRMHTRFLPFDSDRALVYRGRFDATRPNMPGKVTGSDLRAAIEAVLAGEPVSADQFPSMGCAIKWKTGNAPA